MIIDVEKAKDNYKEAFGEKLTNSELAERIGVSPQTLDNWKNGRGTSMLQSYFDLARVTKSTLTELLKHE